MSPVCRIAYFIVARKYFEGYHAKIAAVIEKFGMLGSMMKTVDDQRLWQAWNEKIHASGLGAWAASFLDAFAPLAILGAQVIYVAKPILGPTLLSSHLDSAARLLEDSHHFREFTRLLREKSFH